MDIAQLTASIVFILAYLGITLEHKLPTHKSAVALTTGVLLWIIAAQSTIPKEIIADHLHQSAAEIFSIIMFLLSAMTLVEILVHYQFFDVIRLWLFRKHLTDQKQLFILHAITFFLSAVLDNMTTTIVMIQIARRFFRGKNLLIAVSSIVVLANAGGAWSPLGDVTTIMLWLAGKFSAYTVVTTAFLPSFALAATCSVMFSRMLVTSTKDAPEEQSLSLSSGSRLIIGATLASFALPLLMNIWSLPPYLGLLFGLGFVWLLTENIKRISPHPTDLDANIEKFLRNIDISSLQFFTGILLSVAALNVLGVLSKFSLFLLGEQQSVPRIMMGNIILGLSSAVVDNVPLTALAIHTIHTTSEQLWVLLAITVGTGGSLLVLGSVAGVIAMGMVKELHFQNYLKYASLPALVGYLIAVSVWFLQYSLFFS